MQKKGRIEIPQKDYIDPIELVEIPIKRQYERFHQLNEEEKHKLSSSIGKINWVATQMQPDICLDVLDLSISINKNSTILDLLKAVKLLQKVKANEGTLIYPHFSSVLNPTIFVYTDAAYANLCDRVSSAGGHIIFLQNNNKN